ncbi:hypothetical protein AB9K26_03695 [Psychroserpens sp. XS_ASV72]|uniref:hypothetical protein n=1 Tax=Psychroserpens sp. XS_ASV72 TaxID=3241293 RepID=UPI003513C55C
MKRFIRKIVLFPIGLLLAYGILYVSYDSYLNHSFSNKDSIFIWGDSQAYQGVDLKALSQVTRKKVYSSAHHGAGVYDFLNFVDQVPEDSELIISISKLSQIRRKDKDYNRTGLSFWALNQLYGHDYSFNDVFSIFKLNIKPKRNILESTKLYAYSDSMQEGLPLSHFESYYEEIPEFLDEKQDLYLIGVQKLIDKNCKITFLELPFQKQLKAIENRSPIKGETEAFVNQISRLFKTFEKDTIRLDKTKNIFNDYSHLNLIGAKDLSLKLGENLLKNKNTTLYIAQ